MRAKKTALTAALVVSCLWGCAKVNDTSLSLVSTSVDAYAILNGQVLSGTVVLIPDRTGRVSFSPEKGEGLACAGGMRYTASQSGSIDLSCSDGTATSLHYTLLTETRGYAIGTNPAGPATLVFGLSPQDARAFLSVPAGKRLVIPEGAGGLELQPASNPQ